MFMKVLTNIEVQGRVWMCACVPECVDETERLLQSKILVTKQMAIISTHKRLWI